MFLQPQHLVKAAFLALGVVWCFQVLARLPRDMTEFRAERDWSGRAATIAIWGVTVSLMGWIAHEVGAIAIGIFAFA